MANEKHIFIGLGGSGCQTITKIKEKVYAKRFPTHTATKSRLEAMNEEYRFIFIDTDQRDIDEANERNRKDFENGRVSFINPQTDLVNLGQANPQAIYYEAEQNQDLLLNKRILEACSKELASKIPDQPLAFGAGAFRMKSRIAFAHSLTDFKTKLQTAISSLNDVRTLGGESCTIFYWVVGSSNGGTGSGIINDVLYHINQIHKQVIGDGDPQLILVMYMPKVYIDCNNTEEKYALNAYAVFSEIQAFKEMSLDSKRNTVMHRMAFLSDYNLVDSKRRYCPFYYMIPIDIQTDRKTNLGSTSVMYNNTAEMLYILHAGAGGKTFRSDIDNYMNDIMERNHEDFMVPMGYVQLHKPTEQFASYFNTRFERDILRTWLLNEDDKENNITEEKIKGLYNQLFHQLNFNASDTVAYKLSNKLQDLRDSVTSSSIAGKNELPGNLKYEIIDSELESAINSIKAESITPEKRNNYKQMLIDGIWKQAESWVIEHGLVYAINAVEKVRDYVKAEYDTIEGNYSSTKEKEDDLRSQVEKAYKDTEVTFTEQFGNGNHEDLQNYLNVINEYIDFEGEKAINSWAHDLLRDFCNNEKTDELAKLKAHLMMMKENVAERNEQAVKHYSKLSTDFGNTALDVTTVYLPSLKDICNGNGWKANNFFSRCYKTIIKAEDDKEETANRETLTQFIKEGIYDTKDDDKLTELRSRQYLITETQVDVYSRTGEQKVECCRFFANPTLENRKPFAILDDFIDMAKKQLTKAVNENTKIQENWINKKVSHFFNDLPNAEKEDVRRSLSPSLFFNYNNNRIEVTSKEEHMVFVAQDRDLAKEMLGYEEGNTRHRFVQDGDANSALVLKSKYGLSFQDYSIYDSIKNVYEKASFREKYHFHHEFAQYLGKITLEDLPDDILPQHRIFAKMMLLKEFEDELKPLFYKDPYDQNSYETSIYLTDENIATSFKIARPEAYSIREGMLCIQRIENGRCLFDEIDGANFVIQFEKYFNNFYNRRYNETLNNLLVGILHQKKTEIDADGNIARDIFGSPIIHDGESILKNSYAKNHDAVLKKLSSLKLQSGIDEERRLYNIFYNIIRNEFDTVHKFIG